MEKIVLLTWIMVLTTPVYSKLYSKTVPYEPVQLKKRNLHFYIHDIFSGSNPTAVPITQSKLFAFGELVAIDDPLTEGPEITSKTIGNARGISLSMFSRNPILENPREIALVGGRGQFRHASGFITVNTQYFNTTNGDAVLEFNVEVVHP
ncbi:hypothetical protein ACP275_02G011000 [Erythranthe tilingii]